MSNRCRYHWPGRNPDPPASVTRVHAEPPNCDGQLFGVFERVYETGPVFRAEPYDTARHLAEYVSLDAELGFIRDHRDVLAVLRQALAGMTAALRAHAQPGVDLLGTAIPEVPAEIPVIHRLTP